MAKASEDAVPAFPVAPGRGSAVTVGTFDGVHRGHMEVLGQLKRTAAAKGLAPVAVTFDRHPLEVVCPQRAPKMILGPAERDELLRAEGVGVAEVAFTRQVRSMTCAEWIRLLAGRHGMKALVLGYDNSFGSDCASLGRADYMAIGREAGVEVVEATYVEGCSSSAVRKALESGDVAAACGMLGRPFSVTGPVVAGRRIGRTIGVPTANLAVSPRRQLPAYGVYLAVAVLPGGERIPSVVNIGDNPTVSDRGEVRVEAHLLDFCADLYGRRVTLEFIERLRGEEKFSGLDELRRAIARDIAVAKAKAGLMSAKDCK